LFEDTIPVIDIDSAADLDSAAALLARAKPIEAD
jgi:hypothetical protein